MKYLPRNKNLRSLASKLRSEMTKEERILWYQFLSDHPIRFYRQRIIGQYIVDFYSHRAKIVIELDGSQHFETDTMKRDKERTYYLESLGLQVLCFSNLDVLKNLAGVCAEIERNIQMRIAMNDE